MTYWQSHGSNVWTYQEAQLAKRAVMYADGIADPLDWLFCRANVLGLVIAIRQGRLFDLLEERNERRLPSDIVKSLSGQLQT
jgi:hypothetical protein